MSADVINVQFAQLQESASVLAQKAQQLDQYLQDLYTSLNPIKETWIASGSSAAQAEEQAETQLRQATSEIIEIIQQFSNKVYEAHDTQLALENKNASYFS